MADAFEKVGKDGVITVEEGKTSETTLEFVEGMQFDKGYISPYFVTNPTEMKCELEDALILIYEKKLANVRDMLPLLEKVAQAGKPLLIIAEDVESEALAVLVVNQLRGVLQVCAVKAPGFGDRRKAMLGDIAVLTGGQFISEDLGLKLENVDARPARPGQDGRGREGKHARSSSGAGKKDDIKKRIEQIRAQMDQTESEYDKEKFSERLAKLTGGVAIIRVGGGDRGRDEADEGPRRGRPARHPGGGGRGHRARRRRGPAALHRRRSRQLAKKLKGDERLGAEIVARALEKPVRTIAENSRRRRRGGRRRGAQRGEKNAEHRVQCQYRRVRRHVQGRHRRPDQGDALGPAERRQHRRPDAHDRGDDHQDRRGRAEAARSRFANPLSDVPTATGERAP